MKMRDEMTPEEVVRLDTLTKTQAFLILYTKYDRQPTTEFERTAVEMYEERPGLIEWLGKKLEEL